jgi:hypothetical protein
LKQLTGATFDVNIHERQAMRATGKVLVILLLAACLAQAGEIYGTITDGTKPVPAGAKVEITVAGKVYEGVTDKIGSYRIVVMEKGKGRLTISLSDQSPSSSVVSYDRSTRYDWVVETNDGKLSLRRK